MSKITDPTPMQDVLECSSSKTLPFVSVILPVYNDAEALRHCLKSIRVQTYPKDRFEVIVIDNGSTKDDPKAVVAEFPGYRCSVETKVGSYAARNKGMSLAGGEAFAFIDSDCIASPQWMEEGVRTLLSHPECGLVGGRVDVFAQDPKHPTSVELYQRITALQLKDWIEWHVCGTCNMFVWPKVFDKVGLFNENLKSSGDFEWSRRVHDAGLKLIYNEKVSIQHPARRTWGQIIKRHRRLAGGRRSYQNLQQNVSDYPTSLLHRIHNALMPQISAMRKLCSDNRLKARSERIRVALVFVVLHYVSVLEVIRLMFGGQATRS